MRKKKELINNTAAAGEIAGKNVAVLNLAEHETDFVRQLFESGAKILLSHNSPEEAARQAAEELATKGIMTEFGGHSESVLAADIICLGNQSDANLEIINIARMSGIAICSKEDMRRLVSHSGHEQHPGASDGSFGISEKFLEMD